jgi:hypothetical protein
VIGKLEGKRTFARPRHRWEDNVMDFRETWCKVVDWMHLAEDRNQWRTLVNKIISIQVP